MTKSMLIIDDLPETATAIERYLQEAGGLQGEDVQVWLATSVDELDEDMLAESYDVTLVDLGLGGTKSGLSAIDRLHAASAGGRVIVHSDLANSYDRLLLLYAAFHWYDDQPTGRYPAALLPKKYAAVGKDLKERSWTFKSNIEEILRHGLPRTDRAAAFRKPRRGGEDAFGELFDKPLSFAYLSLCKDYPSFELAEQASNKHVKATDMARWATGAVHHVASLLRQANRQAALTGMRVETFDDDPDHGSNRPTPRLHAFAKSQALFLNDSVARRHFGAA